MSSLEKTKQKTTATKTNRYVSTSLRPVSQIIRPVIKDILPQKSIIFQQIFDLWSDIVNGTEAVSTIPERLTFPKNQQKDGCLAIWAQSSAQAMELTYNKTSLIHRINSIFGFALVSDIKVTAHPTKGLKSKTTQAKVNPNRGVSSQSLDKILGDISNPSLRTILSELGQFLDPQPIDNKDSKGENNA